MICLTLISLRNSDNFFLPSRAFKIGPSLEDRVAILKYYYKKTGGAFYIVFFKPKIVTKFTKRVVSIEQSRHSTSFCNRTRTVSIPVFIFFYTLHSKVPYFFISPPKFVFAHFLEKIELVSKKAVFFSRAGKKKQHLRLS